MQSIKKIKEWLSLVISIPAILIVIYVLGSILWDNKIITLFLMVIIHYVCMMGNQSIFYGYFQSWEWKPFWKDSDLKRVAGEHRAIIKSAVINFMIVIPIVVGIIYTLYYYKLLNFYAFDEIIWFSQDRLFDYIVNAWVLPVYWYIILGFSCLFFGFLIYFLVYKSYPSYKYNVSVLLDHTIPLLQKEFHKYSIRDMLIVMFFCTILLGYTILNTPVSTLCPRGFRSGPLSLPFTVAIMLPIFGYRYHLKWLIYWGIVIFFGWLVWLFVFYIFYIKEYSVVVTNMLRWMIPISLLGTTVIIMLSLGVVIWSWVFGNKNVDSKEYDELNEKMKPWLGFNGRYVSESFISGDMKTFEELYEETHPKKKLFFWIEYFFANILNRNVKTLLQNKKFLWLKVLFNDSNDNKHKKMDPAYPSMAWDDEGFKKRKHPKEIMNTQLQTRIEDPEGDVFLNLELEKDRVENRKPSLWSVFYVTGLIYLNVVPYFVVYNAVILVVFTKFADSLYALKIELLNTLLYGFVGVQGLIFLGFLLAIFANNMGVWLAWRKYYRLKEEGNNEALFFSIFKQRVLYQYINEYTKDEDGTVKTNNYELGLYPQTNIELIDDVAKELSPRNYELYSKKFPLYKN